MTCGIYVVGYQPKPGVPLEDYDFPVGHAFTPAEVVNMREAGHLPPGIILQTNGGRPCVVRGHYFEEQTIEVLQP